VSDELEQLDAAHGKTPSTSWPRATLDEARGALLVIRQPIADLLAALGDTSWGGASGSLTPELAGPLLSVAQPGRLRARYFQALGVLGWGLGDAVLPNPYSISSDGFLTATAALTFWPILTGLAEDIDRILGSPSAGEVYWQIAKDTAAEVAKKIGAGLGDLWNMLPVVLALAGIAATVIVVPRLLPDRRQP
jgi:hypothetical protein